MRNIVVLGLLAVSLTAAGAFADVITPSLDFSGTGDTSTASLDMTAWGSMTATGTVYVKILLWWVPINVSFNTTGIVLNADPQPTNWTADPTGTAQVGFDRSSSPLGSGTLNALNLDIRNSAAWNFALTRMTLTDPSNGFYKFYIDMTGAVNQFRFDMTGSPTGEYKSGSSPSVTYGVAPYGMLTTSYTATGTGQLSLGITFLSNWYAFQVPVGTVFNTTGTIPLPEDANGIMTLTESSGSYPHDVAVVIDANVGPVSLPFSLTDSFTVKQTPSGSNPYFTLTGTYDIYGFMQIENARFTVSKTVPAAIADPNPVTLTITNPKPTYGTVQIDPPPADANTMQYPRGTVITLTAVPSAENKSFRQWEFYDPNYPDDANYAIIDANISTTFVLDDNKTVGAIFKCGSGAGEVLPLLVVGLMGMFFYVRRSR